MGAVVIVRQRGANRFEVGAFKVDTGCLGARDAVYAELDFAGLRKYKEELEKAEPLEEKSAAWGRKFVEEAVAYARQIGFAPARDYKKAARVFGGAKAADCPDTFVFGAGGKPRYTPGPDDSEVEINRILRLLSLKCGRDGYHYILPLSAKEADDYLGHVDEVWLVDEVDSIIERAEESNEAARKRARARLKQLLERYPGSPVVLYGLGMIALFELNLLEARLRFREALVGAPNLSLALHNLSRACFAQNRVVEAKTFAERALKSLPEDHELHKDARNLLRKIEDIQEKSGVSAAAFWEAMEKVEMGVGAMEMERVDQALESFQEALDILPHKAFIWANMGLCYAHMGDPAEGLEHLEKALELDPDDKHIEKVRDEVREQLLIRELRKLDPEELMNLLSTVTNQLKEEFLLEEAGGDKEPSKT